MSPAEGLRVLFFIGFVAAVSLTAAVLAANSLLRRFHPDAAFHRNVPRWVRLGIFLLAGMGVLCMGYGYCIEPYWLSISRVSMTSPALLQGSSPIRIVHFSDLHSDPDPRLEERLPAVIAAERPDLIVFTGDAVNSPAGLPVFRRCLTRIAAIAPTFAVRGNWDVWYWSHLDLFGGTGVRELDGEAVRVTVRGIPVWVAGLPVGKESELKRSARSIPAGELGVFLHHYPDLILDMPGLGIDLYCAGHTHGGQVALPFYGALMTLSRFGKRYEAGLYHEDETWLYVNRGIGMEGGMAPRVRFWARPEVTVIEIGPLPAAPSGRMVSVHEEGGGPADDRRL